jgi:hypothetical protein
MADLKTPPGPDEIRAHAERLMHDINARNGITGDADAMAKAAALPTFSAGTVALDEKTGKPIGDGAAAATATPDIEAGTLPATGDQLSGSPDASVAQLAGAAAVEAAAGVVDTLGGPPPTAAAPDAPATGGAAAVEAAADVTLRDWNDYSPVEYEDGDTGEKYQVFAPKAQAQAVKNGYARRSLMDRHATYLGRAKNVLEPLITDGRIMNLLPLIERAFQDPEYGDFVVDAFNRRISGQPLTPAQHAAADAGAAITAAATPEGGESEYVDPWLKATLEPLQRDLDETKAFVRTMAQREEQQVQARAQQQRIQADANRDLGNAHRELAALYPDAFAGDFARDRALLGKVHKYGMDAGYFSHYGFGPAAWRLAYSEMRIGRADVSSPAADVINSAAAANAAATRSITAVPGGTPAANAPVPRRRGEAVPLRDKSGRMLSPREYAERQVQRLSAG